MQIEQNINLTLEQEAMAHIVDMHREDVLSPAERNKWESYYQSNGVTPENPEVVVNTIIKEIAA